MLELRINDHTGEPYIFAHFEHDSSLEVQVFRLLNNKLKQGFVLKKTSEGGSMQATSFRLELVDPNPAKVELTIDVDTKGFRESLENTVAQIKACKEVVSEVVKADTPVGSGANETRTIKEARKAYKPSQEASHS